MSYWYREGSVDVVNNSDTVNSVATYWSDTGSGIVVGDIFTDNNKLYEIIAVTPNGTTGNDSITLDRPYEGTTATLTGSSKEYAVIRNASATVNTRLQARMIDVLDKLDGKVTVSTTAPAAEQGKDGDIWIVVQ